MSRRGTSDGAGLTCPSAPCAPGATLLGMVGTDGRLAYLRTPLRIDSDFASAARAAGPPEARMRFAAPCQEGRCAQWTGDGCGVVARVLDAVETQGGLPPQPPQPCVIRASCRWFSERGSAACDACSYVITDQEAALAAE